jgi:hypothetical protein
MSDQQKKMQQSRKNLTMGRRQSEPVHLNSVMNPPLSPPLSPGKKRGSLLHRFIQHSNSKGVSGRKSRGGGGSLGRKSVQSAPIPQPCTSSGRSTSGRSNSGRSNSGRSSGRKSAISATSPRVKRKSDLKDAPSAPAPRKTLAKGSTVRHAVQHKNQILYEWEQTSKMVTVFYPAPSSKCQVFCNIAKNLVQLGAQTEGLPCTWFLSHDTGGLVNTAKSHFKHDSENCIISLVKAHPGIIWSRALNDDRIDHVHTKIRPNANAMHYQSLSDRHLEMPRRTKTVYVRSKSMNPNAADMQSPSGSAAAGRIKKRPSKANEEKTSEMSTSSQEERELKRRQARTSSSSKKKTTKDVDEKETAKTARKKEKRRESSKSRRSSSNRDVTSDDPVKPRRSLSSTGPRRSERSESKRTERPASASKSRRRESAASESPRVKVKKERRQPKTNKETTLPPVIVEVEEKRKRTKLPSVEPPEFIFVDMTPTEPPQESPQKPPPPEAIEVNTASDDISILEEPKGTWVDTSSDDISVLEEPKGTWVETISDDISLLEEPKGIRLETISNDTSLFKEPKGIQVETVSESDISVEG